MRSRLAGLVLMLCMASGTLASEGVEGIVLSPQEALKTARQCSRLSPTPVTGTWTPSGNEIKALESALPVYFRAQALEWNGFLTKQRIDPRDGDKLLARYRRQYAGLILGNRKIIYLNAFMSNTFADERFEWRNKAMSVCDGGAIAFGVEFDPATKRFDHFSFNGML